MHLVAGSVGVHLVELDSRPWSSEGANFAGCVDEGAITPAPTRRVRCDKNDRFRRFLDLARSIGETQVRPFLQSGESGGEDLAGGIPERFILLQHFTCR